MVLLRAFLRAPSGVIALVAVFVLTLIAILAPVFLAGAATQLHSDQANFGASLAHPLGTDRLGRDLLARLLVGTRLSLGMGLAAEVIAICIGVSAGTIVVLLGPRARSAMMRGFDVFIAFPALIVTIYLVTILGPSLGLWGLAVGLAIPSALRSGRIFSTLALSVAGRDFLQAARVVGVGGPRILLRYVIPNIAEVLVVSFAVGISGSVIAFSGLSFLGIGAQPPDFDWGRLLTEGVSSFYLTPLAALGPMAFLAATAAAFSLLGEALARASNPLVWTMAGPDQLRAQQALRAARLTSASASTASGRAAGASGDGSRPVALDVRGLWVRFPGHGVMLDIVRDVSLTAHEGEVVGIVGESGSGKTMTAMAISRLISYPGSVSGEIKLLGEDLRFMPESEVNRFLASTLAVVFQDPMSSLNPALTIGRQLTEGAEKHRHLNHRNALRIAIDRLREVNIPTPDRQVERHPHELSGGMRQRVMIAMGLMNEPRLLICDEPTTALDVTIQAQIMDLLARVNTQHKVAIILISHNLGLVRQNCDRVLVMYAGRIVEDLPSDRLLTAPLHPYTRALLHAVPDMTRARGERFTTIPGHAPDPASVPTGCAFHPRCPLKMDRCEIELPPLVTRPDGHRVACWAVEDVAGAR